MRRSMLGPLSSSLIWLAFPAAAQNVANQYTSSAYQQTCSNVAPKMTIANFDEGNCLGFFAGVATTLSVVHSTFKQPSLFCPPDAYSLGEGIDIWQKWLRDHPEQLQLAAAYTFIVSQEVAFPCK